MNPDSNNLDAELRRVLSRYPELRLAIVFGSCAAGNAGRTSDLDLAVLAVQPLDSATRAKLIGDLATAFDRPIDLVDLKTVGEPLLGEVFKGRRILGQDAVYAQLLTRHLLDVADFLPLRERILEERRRRWIGS
jgi:predicted nucleotidyltransferase